MDEQSRAHLAARYGHAAHDVMELRPRPPDLAARISPGLPDLAAEAAFAARASRCCSVADVLLRRTRLGLLDARGLAAPGAEGAAWSQAPWRAELGWDEAQCEREIADWRERRPIRGARAGHDRASAPEEAA